MKIKSILKKHQVKIIVFSTIILFIVLSYLFWFVYFPSTYKTVQFMNQDFNQEQTQIVLDVFDLNFNHDEYIKEGYVNGGAGDVYMNFFIYDASQEFRNQITTKYQLYYMQDLDYRNYIDNTSFSGETYYLLNEDNTESWCVFYEVNGIKVAYLSYWGYSEELMKALK